MIGPGPRRGTWLALTLVTALLIAALTLGQGARLPVAVPGSDTLHHAVAFGALVLPTALLRWTRAGLVALLTFLYGGLIEMVQPFVGRERETLDLLANGAGILVALALGAGLRRLRAARRPADPETHGAAPAQSRETRGR